jgi:hypothetical protein
MTTTSRYEHAIKFADTAADVHERTGNPAAIAAAGARRGAHPATGAITGPRRRRSRPERKHRHTSHITPTGTRYHHETLTHRY